MYLDPHVAPQCCILLSCHWKNHASFILSPFQRELGGVAISSIMSRNNTRTSKAKPPTWLASMIEFPLCVVSWPSYDNTTTVTLMYMMKPPSFAKLINDKIFVILFETSHRTHVLVYLISKLIFFSTFRWQSLALNRSSCPWSRRVRESRRIPRKIVTMGDDVIIPPGLCDLPGEVTVSHNIVYDCIMSMDASHC